MLHQVDGLLIPPTIRNYSSPSSSSFEQFWESSALEDDVSQLDIPEDLMHSEYLFAECMCAKQ
jgi:hypothetical protein